MPGEIGDEQEQPMVGYHENTTNDDRRNDKEQFQGDTSWGDSKPQSPQILRMLKRIRERSSPENKGK